MASWPATGGRGTLDRRATRWVAEPTQQTRLPQSPRWNWNNWKLLVVRLPGRTSRCWEHVMAAEQSTPKGPDLARGVPLSDLGDGRMVGGHAGEEALPLAPPPHDFFPTGTTPPHYAAPPPPA